MDDNYTKMVDTLLSGAAIIEPRDGLEEKLRQSFESRIPLRVKLGFDPTAPDLHLGHAVVSKKLRQFQDFGHKIIIIIGDYTAQRGDPSGRKDTRPPLTEAQVAENAQTYLNQIGLVIDLNEVEIHRNSEWYKEMSFSQALDLAQKFNIARLFERRDFGDRYKSGQSVTLSELMYPGLQGHDSIEINADIEIGGTDQVYNLLVGRDLQRAADQSPQVALCMPILPGTDGIIKMSKSKNNYIGLAEPPETIFQKVMRLPDIVTDGDKEVHVIETYVDLLVTNEPVRTELLKTLTDIKAGTSTSDQYVTVKKALAHNIVEQFHGREKADFAKAHSERIQSLKLGSAQLQEVSLTSEFNDARGIVLGALCRDLLHGAGIEPIGSNNPRRLIENGAVKVDGKSIKDPNENIKPKNGMIVAVGKKLAFQLLVPGNF